MSGSARLPLSVVIITLNEERNLGRCLKSVAWAAETIVVDSGSTDRTLEIAKEHGAKVHVIEWAGFGPAKGAGVAQASHDWVLSVDADEEVSNELADEIRRTISNPDASDGYDMPRKTRFLGRWIKHCGWYPDRVLRLFKKSKGGFNDARIHEAVEVNGSVGHLSGELLHHCYPSLEHYLAKSNRYTTIGAREAYRSGKRAGVFDLVIRPPVSFISHYFVRQGFLDGLEGLLVSALSAVAVLVKYAKLRQIQRNPELLEQEDQ